MRLSVAVHILNLADTQIPTTEKKLKETLTLPRAPSARGATPGDAPMSDDFDWDVFGECDSEPTEAEAIYCLHCDSAFTKEALLAQE